MLESAQSVTLRAIFFSYRSGLGAYFFFQRDPLSSLQVLSGRSATSREICSILGHVLAYS